MNEQLFGSIEEFGVKEVPKEEKAILVTDLEGVLVDLQVNSALVRDVVSKTTELQPYLRLVYKRKPMEEDTVKREGRGVYHEVQVSGQGTSIYVKGIGNETVIGDDLMLEGGIPGFPGSTERLMFDHMLSFNEHPRIIGTETLSWGFLEFLNASIVFAELSKKHDWKSLDEAVKAGVTIPIGLVHFRELSHKMQDLLRQRMAETPHDHERDFLSWEGNFKGLGAVGQIVPANERHIRMPRGSEDEKTIARDYEALKEPTQWRTAGRTLRTLLDMGITYSLESSHGQNLYTRGEVAQADNSDLVFLGDYRDRNVEDLFHGEVNLSAVEQRTALIYSSLSRHDALTPLGYPVPEHGVSMQDVYSCQYEFLSEYLRGIVPEKVIKELPHLMPVFREQITLAVAQVVIRSQASDSWERLSDIRQQLLLEHDKFGAKLELDGKIEGNLKPYETISFRQRVGEDDPLGVQSMLSYLKSGDVSHLMRDQKLRPLIDLLGIIGQVQDTSIRDELLNKVAMLQLSRDYDGITDREGSNLDVIDIFNNQHLTVIQRLVAEGNFDKAKKAMALIERIAGWRLAINHPIRNHEHAMLAFAQDIISGEDIDELTEQAEFLDKTLKLQARTSRGLIASVLLAKSDINIGEWTYERKLSNPQMILFGTVGRYLDDPQIRKQLLSYMDEYETRLIALVQAPYVQEQHKIAGELKLLAAQFTDIPELEFAHNLTMATVFIGRDYAFARSHYDDALQYYSSTYESRKLELGYNHDELYRNPAQYRDDQKRHTQLLRKRLIDNGYAKAAKLYRE